MMLRQTTSKDAVLLEFANQNIERLNLRYPPSESDRFFSSIAGAALILQKKNGWVGRERGRF